jgi:hypothetical protein
MKFIEPFLWLLAGVLAIYWVFDKVEPPVPSDPWPERREELVRQCVKDGFHEWRCQAYLRCRK